MATGAMFDDRWRPIRLPAGSIESGREYVCNTRIDRLIVPVDIHPIDEQRDATPVFGLPIRDGLRLGRFELVMAVPQPSEDVVLGRRGGRDGVIERPDGVVADESGSCRFMEV